MHLDGVFEAHGWAPRATSAPVTFASAFVLEAATVRGSGALALVEGKPMTRARRVRAERVAAVFALGGLATGCQSPNTC